MKKIFFEINHQTVKAYKSESLFLYFRGPLTQNINSCRSFPIPVFGNISAQPHPTLCIQFLNRENNDKNNTLPLGKQICFTIVWGCAKILPGFLHSFGLHIWEMKAFTANQFLVNQLAQVKITIKNSLKDLRYTVKICIVLVEVVLWSRIYSMYSCNFTFYYFQQMILA